MACGCRLTDVQVAEYHGGHGRFVFEPLLRVNKGLVLENWSGRGDLNSRPLAPQASALAGLRYAPTEIEDSSPRRYYRPARVFQSRRCFQGKFQASTSKLQRNFNHQDSNNHPRTVLGFEAWCLECGAFNAASSQSCVSHDRRTPRHIPSTSRTTSDADAR